MVKGKLFFLPLCFIVIVLVACNKGAIYQKYIAIPDKVWDTKSPVTFKVNVPDTTNYYNIFVNIRNGDSYEYSNIYLFIDVASPMHITERDTMECILADPNSGRWLGQGLGDIWDNKILFKRNVRFPRIGEYDFTYTQAMRTDKLAMIIDAGLVVELANASAKTSK